jgi:hypothetical protein
MELGTSVDRHPISVKWTACSTGTIDVTERKLAEDGLDTEHSRAGNERTETR